MIKTIKFSSKEDIDSIMVIIKQAQDFLASQNIDQWQNGYPNVEQIEKDINNNNSYKLTDSDNKLMAILMFTTNKEPTYEHINGEWLTKGENKYGVIHRLAISNEYRKMGLARFIFQYFETILADKNIKTLRVDTHPDNTRMQQVLKTMDYKYCGIINLEDKTTRLAYEKIIIKTRNNLTN